LAEQSDDSKHNIHLRRLEIAAPIYVFLMHAGSILITRPDAATP
jgi:hypothetical protein